MTFGSFIKLRVFIHAKLSRLCATNTKNNAQKEGKWRFDDSSIPLSESVLVSARVSLYSSRLRWLKFQSQRPSGFYSCTSERSHARLGSFISVSCVATIYVHIFVLISLHEFFFHAKCATRDWSVGAKCLAFSISRFIVR